MTSGGGAKLYTPELLALAVALAEYPFDAAAHVTGTARSRTCGSTAAFSASLAGDRITQPGVRVTACAVGQAAAAIFAQHADGRSRADIAAARAAIGAWLSGEGPEPDWPGFPALDRARDYPARHGAVTLAWDAALAALPNDTEGS